MKEDAWKHKSETKNAEGDAEGDAEGEPGKRDISDQREGHRVKKLGRSVVFKKKKKHHSVNNKNLEEIYHWIL